MLSFINKFFDYNEKEINKLRKIVIQINDLEDKARVLKDTDFKKETEVLKEEIQSGKKTLDEVLPWAYALVREASRRTIGLRQFDEQIMAGIALHQGKIAEQKTGEGKTLSAVAPLYLNSLEGKGAHLVTVNDYLARRDMGWMGDVFDFLGTSVSAMISEKSYIFDKTYVNPTMTDWRMIHLKEVSRKEAYLADVTYGINSEFGFDYLRDNMVYRPDDIVQRSFNYAVIDEVDSVLIDEARTPHIISAPYDEDTSKYYGYAKTVNKLEAKDYIVDEKQRSAHLTEEGIATIEKMLGVENIYEKDFDTLYHIEAALKAKTLYKNDKDYIVRGDEVIIVDEFTGRLLEGRRFSEGLHQAIEAKENVSIKRESRTLATVSLQNYFRQYKKLAGMTGTAATEAEEFHKIYKLDVVVLPTHREMVRQDYPDLIYKTESGKFSALVLEITKQHETGRPILVGTTSIEKNELLSSVLKKNGVPHQLMNAKNHEKESQIIAEGGKKGAVTIATNMAGRGVDIVLGGQPPNKYEIVDDKEAEKRYNAELREWEAAHDEVVKRGGLLVIGTERHESRRIDNQLRGRAGRQGDPGETRFFVSLEDEMIRIFGGEQVSNLMNFFKIPEDQPLEHAMVSRALNQAQIKVEGFNFDSRKHLVEFDDVINKQRGILYELRRKIVLASSSDKKELEKIIQDLFSDEVKSIVNMYMASDPLIEDLAKEFTTIVSAKEDQIQKEILSKHPDEVEKILLEKIEKEYSKKTKSIGRDLYMDVIRSMYLETIDRYWTDHLTAIDDLREGINLRGYAQLDPLVEYKNQAFTMFEKLLNDIDYDISRRILKIEMAEAPQQQQFIQNLIYNAAHDNSLLPGSEGDKPQSSPTQNLGSTSKKEKLGRNDPCWCGSGKKYKKCHLLSDQREGKV